MKSDIEILLSGPDFPAVVPIAASFSYSINGIPVATAELDGRSNWLLCNFERQRRKLVTLEVRTTKGCLRFDGFIDGCTLSQSTGSLGLSLVIKSRFQWLLETFTRVPGLHPDSLAVFNNLPTLSADMNPTGVVNFVSGVQLGQYALAKVDMNQPLFQAVKTIYTEALNLLADSPRIFASEISMLPTVKITEASETFLADKLPMARAMLASLDTTAVDGILLNASAAQYGPDLINTTVQTLQGSLFEALVQMAQQYGCNIVVANNKMYVIPDVGFLKIPHTNGVLRTKHSVVPNIVYPAEYTGFQFNDQGYRDIKGCYLASLPNSMPMVTNGGLTRCLGHYIDPTATGGVLIDTLPQFVSGPLEFLAQKHSASLVAGIRAGIPRTQDGVLNEQQVEAQNRIIAADTDKTTNDFTDKIGNNWAQLTYLQRKFADRTGSINAIFDPGWAPGGVGTLFARYPGTWIDFRVTSVSHNFTAAPGGATASTSVSFDCGRMGGETVNGIDTIDFYQYNYTKSAAYSADFVANVS